MSDLITAHPSLLSLLSRLGVSLGFGDRSIADVCEDSGVDTAFFLLPHIECHLDAIAQKLNGRIGKVFISFFKEYKEEVETHFMHEERDVFPHIRGLMAGKRDATYSIGEFIDTHSDIEGKLDDLLNIVFKYLPPQVDDDNVLDVVDDILRLSEDLKKHTFIEEKIMVPLVKHLENAILKK